MAALNVQPASSHRGTRLGSPRAQRASRRRPGVVHRVGGARRRRPAPSPGRPADTPRVERPASPTAPAYKLHLRTSPATSTFPVWGLSDDPAGIMVVAVEDAGHHPGGHPRPVRVRPQAIRRDSLSVRGTDGDAVLGAVGVPSPPRRSRSRPAPRSDAAAGRHPVHAADQVVEWASAWTRPRPRRSSPCELGQTDVAASAEHAITPQPFDDATSAHVGLARPHPLTCFVPATEGRQRSPVQGPAAHRPAVRLREQWPRPRSTCRSPGSCGSGSPPRSRATRTRTSSGRNYAYAFYTRL